MKQGVNSSSGAAVFKLCAVVLRQRILSVDQILDDNGGEGGRVFPGDSKSLLTTDVIQWEETLVTVLDCCVAERATILCLALAEAIQVTAPVLLTTSYTTSHCKFMLVVFLTLALALYSKALRELNGDTRTEFSARIQEGTKTVSFC